jgi:hypothetical protein
MLLSILLAVILQCHLLLLLPQSSEGNLFIFQKLFEFKLNKFCIKIKVAVDQLLPLPQLPQFLVAVEDP